MIFLTVGTYPLPFDRLLIAVDETIATGVIEEEVFAQVGLSSYRPQNMRYAEMLDKETFDSHFQKASGIIGHAGMGTITMALDYNKPLLAMPRLKKCGEIVNDHQVAIAKKFEELGHILVAYSKEELPEKLRELKTFFPKPRENQVKAVADRVHSFLNSLSESHFE
jgi:UDP-N-acetylglucosamine transferase subunit ALG13